MDPTTLLFLALHKLMSRYILRAESASRQLVHRFSNLNGSGFSQMKVSPVATFFLPAAASLLASSSCHAFVAGTNTHHATSTTQQRKMSSTALGSKPFAVVVQAEVRVEHMDEFLSIMKKNAECSRMEPDCLQFGE